MMKMIVEVNENEFIAAFRDEGLSGDWSSKALTALYEWLEPSNVVVSVRTLNENWREYDSAREAVRDYGFDDLNEIDALIYLKRHTTALTYTNTRLRGPITLLECGSGPGETGIVVRKW